MNFLVSPWILYKNRTFSYRRFSQKLISEKFFFRYCSKKRMILEEKIKVFKRAKRWTFSKGLVHGFCRKIELFLIGVFHRNHIRKKSFFILRKEKNDFKRKKLKFVKGPKNRHFRKGLVHGFCLKIEISLIAVFYRNYVRKDRFSIFWKENNHF